MKRWLFLAVAALALAGAGAAGLSAWPIGRTVELTTLKGDAGRGAYLARMSGCIACHTDTAGSGAPLAGGVRLETDFGTFYSPNLTTDNEQGIGRWTVSEFEKAVRQGVSPEGEPYYPVFPYPFYARLSDQDVADLWAAFQTVPANAAPSRPQDLHPPFGFRPALKLWRWASPKSAETAQANAEDALLKRGRFIVEGPGHCGACHTPRDWFGIRNPDRKFDGAGRLPDGGKSPAINAEALKQRGWTIENLRYALKTGIMPDGDVFGGSMGEVVRDGTAFLTDRDRTAIATYLLERDR